MPWRYTLSFAAEAEERGAQIALRTEVRALGQGSGRLAGGDAQYGSAEPAEAISAAAVVNAAGLDSDGLAARAGFDVDACGYRLHPCKGDYFSLAPGARRCASRSWSIRCPPDRAWVCTPRSIWPGASASVPTRST